MTQIIQGMLILYYIIFFPDLICRNNSMYVQDDKLVTPNEVGKFFSVDFSLAENLIHYH
jgi:hypothetical protein